MATSCNTGRRCSLDPVLLWCRAAAAIQLLAWELPYAAGTDVKRKKYILKKTLCPCKVTVRSCSQHTFSQQEVMSVEDESTSCYCLLDPFACHVLLDSFGTYALTGEPITDCAVKQLKVAVFGCMSCNSLDYNLRVYCVDNTPCAFQVSPVSVILLLRVTKS